MSDRITKGHQVPKPATFQAIHDSVRLARSQGMRRKDLLYWATECWRIHGHADKAVKQK